MNYFECTALHGTPLTPCGNKAVQWYAMYLISTSNKYLSRPALARVLRYCQQHKIINENPHPIILGRFLTEEEVTVLSVMEDSPEKIFKEEDKKCLMHV